MSAQAVMLLALFSACSRACLNIIDRKQFGYQNLSILGLNFLNNAVPAAIFSAVIVLVFHAPHNLSTLFLNWRVIIFSFIAQLTAYVYSYAFRHLTVNQVIISGKFSDIFIPAAIFLTTWQWNTENYIFSLAGTAICLPILWQNRTAGYKNFLKITALICFILTVQAALSPILITAEKPNQTEFMLSFSAAVMLWRAVWACIPALLHHQTWLRETPALLTSPLFLLRSSLTLLTQITFIYAVSSPLSILAWPILNITGLLAMALSAVFLHEKIRKTELYVILAFSLLTVIRFATL